jgi:two-component system, OmpR family, sensor histidine kinase CpxA
MRSLFLKIFLWFWATAILTGVALILTFVLQPGGVPARWHMALSETARMYGRAAVGEMEHGGPAAVADYLQDLSRSAHTQACLFDQHGSAVAGSACATFLPLVRRAAATSTASAFGIRYGLVRVALQVAGRNGVSYIFATELPAGPRAAFGPDPLGLALHWGVALLVSGFICYLLARYLTAPILQLGAASRQLAAGKLNTRAAAGSQKRNDELGELIRDFNAMAARIESLVCSQRQLISDVSHELRSPLARLIVAMDLARERKGNDPAFERMEKDFDRLNEMVGRLLTVARLDASDASIQMKIVNLSVLVSEVVSDAEFAAYERQRSVHVSSDENMYVRGNPDLLRSAIENIILNAVRYTAPGTVIDVHLRREARVCALCVRDHGPGVPESELVNIFRPFYRVANARDEQSGGIGLGLAITDRVVRLHAGSLSATNALDGGLEVEIRIPIAQRSDQADISDKLQ